MAMTRARRRRRFVLAGAATLAAYLVAAYLVLPLFWSEEDRRDPLPAGEMVTRTGEGRAGDPLNIGFVAAPEVLLGAFHRAGWHPADAITFETSVGIVGSVLFDRPDADAPVSPLFYDGRREDLAFEKEVGASADRRQHVRLWRQPAGEGGTPLWIGAVSFDEGVGFSHYTGAVTHRISPDVDGARDALAGDIAAAARIERTYEIDGVGETRDGRNGEGDTYDTDGKARILVIAGPPD